MKIDEILTTIMLISAFITTLGGAIAIVKSQIKDSKVTRHDDKLNKHDEELRKLNERLTVLEANNKRQDEYVEAMCRSMLALLEHNINGNSVAKLKEAKEAMQEFLIRGGR